MRYLSVLVFTTGFVTLGMELSASRLLEPAFGNNQIVWASLIGLILLYLAVGAWLGGRLADRYPRRGVLDGVLTLGAVGVALVPTLSAPVLRMASLGLADFALGLLVGSLLAVLLLFSVPGILLGTASPWAVRLTVDNLSRAGRTAGRLYALATAGSILGAFVPVLWLIPAYGTRWTFYLLALLLLAVLAIGSLRHRHRWAPLAGLLAVTLLMAVAPPNASTRRAWDDGRSGQIIYEDESLYNYVVVRQWGDERHLKLNDGVGIHSVYHPQSRLSLGIWDYFLLAPLFAQADGQPAAPQSALILGLAAGTASGLLTDIYGPIPITGIELDPAILEVGRTYFAMDQPNLTAIAADGRAWLAQQPATAAWDLVIVDAYRPPYIPFHLTTVEFFRLVRDHLTEDGVVAINVGRTAHNFALVDALAAALAQVFPSVYAVDEPGPEDTLGNSLLVATMQPTAREDFMANVATLPADLPPEFLTFAAEAAPGSRPMQPDPNAPLFTDDRAPVEQVVHGIILDFLRQ